MLKQMLIDSSKYGVKCPYTMTPKGICIHNTANDASAVEERNNVNRWDNNAEVSFHVAIDDIEAIQLIPFNRNAWHSSDGGNGPGNRNYIAVEICYSKSGGERFINAEKRAAKEVASLLKQYGWTISNVKKHQDFSNKYCPHRTLDMGWQRFLNMIQLELNGPVESPIIGNDYSIGNKVKVIGTNYATGEVIPGWVKENTYEVIQVSNSKVLLGGIMSWVYTKDIKKINNTSNNTPKPVQENKKYLNLNKHVNSWRVYPTTKAPVIGNEVGSLAPSRYGGLSYEILGNPQVDVYTIKTETFGKVNIYAPRDNDSSITGTAVY